MGTHNMKALSFVISRGALHRSRTKYPDYFFQSTRNESKNAQATAWPRSMQIAGYLAVALSIPYSFIVTVSESPRLKDLLEGDPILDSESSGNDINGIISNTTIFQKFVHFVRWYWGHEDHIPYHEWKECEDRREISLITDIPTLDRVREARIQSQVNNDVNLRVETPGGSEHVSLAPGRILVSDVGSILTRTGFQDSQNETILGNDESNTILLSFEDDDTKLKSDTNVTEFALHDPSQDLLNTSIAKRSSIWSAWHQFNIVPMQNTQHQSSTSMDSHDIHIEDLKCKIRELLSQIQDPKCTKDRDDMSTELNTVQKELSVAKRERRMAKLKKFVLV